MKYKFCPKNLYTSWGAMDNEKIGVDLWSDVKSFL